MPAHNSVSEGAAGREMGIMENKLLAKTWQKWHKNFCSGREQLIKSITFQMHFEKSGSKMLLKIMILKSNISKMSFF